MNGYIQAAIITLVWDKLILLFCRQLYCYSKRKHDEVLVRYLTYLDDIFLLLVLLSLTFCFIIVYCQQHGIYTHRGHVTVVGTL